MSLPDTASASGADDRLHFEDFTPGLTIELEGPTVSEAQIIEFARQYDPQPIHIDPAAAARGPFGEVIASGWMTGSIAMRLICDSYVLRSAAVVSPGLDELRWLRPVRPGDRLRLRMTVLESRLSRSKPDRGSVKHHWQVFNQRDEEVMSMIGWGIFLRRVA
jgi:acyl dehydratase